MNDGSDQKRAKPIPLGLFDQKWLRNAKIRGISDWPAANKFPINLDKEKVEDILLQDIRSSQCPVIITGFTSLDYLIDVLTDLPEDRPNKISILLGSEPSPARRSYYRTESKPFSQEVVDYWLEAGISLRLCHKIVLFIEMLQTGRVEAKYIPYQNRKLHAKIYITDAAASLGSSNFSFTGFRKQLEANARFDAIKEHRRYKDIALIANNYWSLGECYKDDLLNLLNQLLKVVSWEEALGRACGELLEGDWAKRYIKSSSYVHGNDLWPSQKSGIAQALWMVENVGSVLIADATGAGKTRMGAYLLRAIMDRIWSTGRARKDLTLMVCPPNVVEKSWLREAAECGLPLKTLSHGILSRKSSDDYFDTINLVRRAQSLAIDEAHNFLNSQSSRTRSLLGNMADVVLMFTATPINKGIGDLLRIVDLLGADNLDDSALKLFDRLEKRQRKNKSQFATSRTERLEMQKEVQRFTLRRTKAMLNNMVDKNPEAYCDDRGKQCRYPKHVPQDYKTSETKADEDFAIQIRKLAGQLKGLVNLHSGIDIPAGWQKKIDEERYIKGRLLGARGLAIYHVMSRLRSSRAALIEHLHGTDYAMAKFHIVEKIKSEETGNVLHKLEAGKGKITNSSILNKLPAWLRDPSENRKAVNEELSIYRKILELVEQVSDEREKGKARKLLKLLKSHSLILAFDSCLITLEVLKQFLMEEESDCTPIVATGSRAKNRKKVNKLFELGSSAERVIALCSDAMSEGLNLQQASCVVLLDMPSVIRVAEQRVGRVDRMNSPHEEIEVWWPRDSEAFSLKTDRKFYLRYSEVRDVLGSNIDLPENLVPEELEEGPSTVDQMIKKLEEIEKEGGTWDGIHDAFQPVRDLIDPEIGMVPQDVYEQVKDSSARVLSSISLIKADSAWGFFAISGLDRGAPKWIFLDNPKSMPITHLETVSDLLRGYLTGEIERRELDEEASVLVHQFLNQILLKEKDLLPRKKQRALEEMAIIIDSYINSAKDSEDWDKESTLRSIRNLLEIPSNDQDRPDLDSVAETWLDLTRDVWYEKLRKRRGLKPLRLKDIRKDLKQNPIPFDELNEAFLRVPTALPIFTRVVSAIVGVPA